MSSKDTLDFIVSFLVDHPDDVHIDETESGRSFVYELVVHPDDIGKVIGRGGRIAKALRTVVKAAALREDRNVIVEIVD